MPPALVESIMHTLCTMHHVPNGMEMPPLIWSGTEYLDGVYPIRALRPYPRLPAAGHLGISDEYVLGVMDSVYTICAPACIAPCTAIAYACTLMGRYALWTIMRRRGMAWDLMRGGLDPGYWCLFLDPEVGEMSGSGNRTP